MSPATTTRGEPLRFDEYPVMLLFAIALTPLVLAHTDGTWQQLAAAGLYLLGPARWAVRSL